MVKQIRKRDGRLQKFNATKIANAINLAYGGDNDVDALLFAADITNILAAREQEIIDIEVVQDEVEQYLMEKNKEVAKKYILYRKDRERMRNAKATMFNYKKTVEEYLNVSDWRVKENSTVNYSLGGLVLNNSGAITANYWLSEVYDCKAADAHRTAAIHIHDLSMLSAYCAGWDLEKVIREGVGGVEGKITSHPPKHLHTLCNQLVNFLGIMQNEWAGAQAFSSFDTYLAPFVKVDNLTYKETKQAIQSFIFGVNTPSRWGCQAPFSNITLDWIVPPDLADKPALVGGEEMDFKYKDCQKEMDMVNKAFLEVMLEGDANGRGFQYPIPTYSLTREFDWSATENNQLLFEMTAKYGTPYFSNYINSDMEPSDVRSMCCRLRLDLRELRKKSGGYFGSGSNTGSVGVVTLNMPRIAYLATDKADFYQRLDELMDISALSLKVKRDLVSKLLDDGLYPYTKRYLGNFDNHFSTIGLVGMNEACLNAKWIAQDLTHKEAIDFTEEVLNHMRHRLSDYQEKYGDLYNLEATPAESTAYRLAKHDKERYPGIVTAKSETGTPYYTNSSHLPVGYTQSVSEALEIQDRLQVLYTSGTVFHVFLGQKLQDWKIAANIVRKIAENYQLPYFTMSPTYSICREHGYISGEHFSCPTCHEKTEVYSRITGYYRPIQNWNDGKKAEFNERKEYVIEEKDYLDQSLTTKIITQVDEVGNELTNKKFMLFTTRTCPNCRFAKLALDERGIAYDTILAEDEVELAKHYNISQVPTLVVVDHNKNVEQYANYGNIAKFIQRQA
ncbi:MAG: ribonucleoside triphosphate reductase [Bacilli bacterium]